jgi:hypothetical protein
MGLEGARPGCSHAAILNRPGSVVNKNLIIEPRSTCQTPIRALGMATSLD